MAFSDLFSGEENMVCTESFGYDNSLYNSPTYSDDSGFGQAFSLDDILLSDVLPPVMNDMAFAESIEELQRSTSVSSSIHDHSYFATSDHKETNLEINLPEASSSKLAKQNRKRTYSESSSKENEPLIKKEPQHCDLNIDILQCDDETFSYKDENGKVVVVDKSRKNAEMARLNRQRKKRHISNLESEVKSLRGRNDKLMQLKSTQENKIENLENEVAYLMSVIRNQTKLSSVLRAVSNVPGISLSNSDKNNRSSTKINFSERLPGKRAPVEIEENEYNGGVCLHVSDNKVSLEFCAGCNKKQSQ